MTTKPSTTLLAAFAACLLTPALSSAASVSLSTHAGLRVYSTTDFAIGGSVSGFHTEFDLELGVGTGVAFSANNLGVVSAGANGVTLGNHLGGGILTLALPSAVYSWGHIAIWEAGLMGDSFGLKVSTDNGATWSSSVSFTTTPVIPPAGVSSPESELNSVFAPMSSFNSYIGGGMVNRIEISGSIITHPDIVAVAIPEPSTSLGVCAGLIGLCFSRRRRGAQE